MKKVLLLTVLGVSLILNSSCKQEGCTDPFATNYSSEASKDDGSCFTPSVIYEEFWVTFTSTSAYEVLSTNHIGNSDDFMIIEVKDFLDNWSAVPFSWGEVDKFLYGSHGEYGVFFLTTRDEAGNNYYPSSPLSFNVRVAIITKSAIELNPELENMTISELKTLDL
ncbi:MAG: hypothetical protein QNK23_02890 [Crocinitomicaceae bacterium]|nr:hypothetical protein [Crocinitomicaceae bacterium]